MMAREHHGDEPTPVDPTPLGEMIFGRELEPDDEVTREIPTEALRPPQEEPPPAAPPARPDAPAQPAPDAALPSHWWSDDERAADSQRAYDHRAYERGYEPEPSAPVTRPVPTGAAPAAAAPSAAAARPAPQQALPPRPPERRGGVGRVVGTALLLLGALAAGALIALAALSFLGGDDPAPTAGTQAPTTSAAEPTTQASSPSSTTSSPTSSATRSGQLPSGATACDGAKEGVSAGRTNDVTSCPFAIAVRDAYVGASPGDDGAATLTVKSPVTGRTYTMRCSGTGVTTCTGGDNASVVLY